MRTNLLRVDITMMMMMVTKKMIMVTRMMRIKAPVEGGYDLYGDMMIMMITIMMRRGSTC